MSYSIIKSEKEKEKALAVAKGCFQIGLIEGSEALSLATLKGKARRYGAKYAISRNNFLRRLTDNGVIWSEQIGAHNKRILVIG